MSNGLMGVKGATHTTAAVLTDLVVFHKACPICAGSLLIRIYDNHSPLCLRLKCQARTSNNGTILRIKLKFRRVQTGCV